MTRILLACAAMLLSGCDSVLSPTSPSATNGGWQFGLPSPGPQVEAYYEITLPAGPFRPGSVITVSAQLVRYGTPVRAGGDTVTWRTSPAHGRFAAARTVTNDAGQTTVDFTFGAERMDALQFKLTDQRGRLGHSAYVVSR